jgi:uncharacterized protein YceH (UPF0502 family)
MYRFDSLEDVESTLDRLMRRAPPLVRVLPRQPGTKEARYMHLLSGEGPAAGDGSALPVAAATADGERIARLETEVALLKSQVEDLRRQLLDFIDQFK